MEFKSGLEVGLLGERGGEVGTSGDEDEFIPAAASTYKRGARKDARRRRSRSRSRSSTNRNKQASEKYLRSDC